MKCTKGASSKYIEDTVDVDVGVVILCPLETKKVGNPLFSTNRSAMVYPGAKNPVAGSSTSFDLEIRELHITAVPWVLLEVFWGVKKGKSTKQQLPEFPRS